ncbi:hypothetical protein J437_LFUL018377 [Ladona fulva]|uniref:Uncharacterized protein n=1 Tax=Ladona fulva TaxID=123851 RepID=A0A8K0PC84_LADFU|nr:hypothetical protein J437_LFUL018377 [Ladona fulva]
MLIPNPKKLRGEDVLHLVLALSLLGSHHPFQGVRYAGNLKDPSIHSSLLIGAYQTEVFHDLLALGRYSRSPWRPCREPAEIVPSQCRDDADWPSRTGSTVNGRMHSSGVHVSQDEDYPYGGSVTAYLLDVETSGGVEEEGGEDAGEDEVIKMEDGDDFLEDLPFGPPAREEEVIDESPLMKVEEDDWESVPIKVETSEEVNGWEVGDSDAEWGIDEVGGPLVEWSDVILKPEDDDDDVLPPLNPQYFSDEEEALALAEDSTPPELFGSSSELSCEPAVTFNEALST